MYVQFFFYHTYDIDWFCILLEFSFFSITFYRNVVAAREAWVETLDTNTSDVGMITLHPDVFSVCPRMDIIHENVVWQRKYKMVVSKMAGEKSAARMDFSSFYFLLLYHSLFFIFLLFLFLFFIFLSVHQFF